MSKRVKKAVSLDWALVVVLSLSLLTSFYTLLRFRRFVRDVDLANKSLSDGFRRDSEERLRQLLDVVNGFVGRSPGVVSNPVSSVSASVPTTNSTDVVHAPSPLPGGFWVSQVNGEWLLTDGHFAYSVGSLSPVGLLISCAPGVVVSECGVFYSNPIPSIGVSK